MIMMDACMCEGWWMDKRLSRRCWLWVICTAVGHAHAAPFDMLTYANPLAATVPGFTASTGSPPAVASCCQRCYVCRLARFCSWIGAALTHV